VQPGGLPAQTIGKAKGHRIRFMANINSGYPVPNHNWTTLRDGVKFRGVELGSRASLLPLAYETRQIEFLGDSITASLRLLYATHKVDTPVTSSPETNWTEQTARALGLRAIVNGHGGQGITGGSTDGTPPAQQAFGSVCAGVKWQPETKPEVVVVYQGTNDGAFTAGAYQEYLAVIRRAYPRACIFAVVPFAKANHAPAIRTAVTGLGDPQIFFLDYSLAFNAATDMSDGLHFNPTGAAKMGARLAGDIRKQLPPLFPGR
jgi:lysophospholipase L1-like esterase